MRNKNMLIGVGVGILVGVLLASVVVVLAGSIDSPSGPTDSASQMYTLNQIYNRLTGQGNATKMTTFTEPSSGPGSTMHTLDEIYALAWPARAPKTGQTTSSATGDDGDLKKGVTWPNPRFTDNNNGTVTDNLTGLIWLKNANCFGTKTWANALSSANTLNSGECGLSDGSAEGDWRLPNVRELHSLIHWGFFNPALPNTAGTGKLTEGDPFTGVQTVGSYWSSTDYAWFTTTSAWEVDMDDGYVSGGDKANGFYVWPARGGQ
jgi:hypothetical protein